MGRNNFFLPVTHGSAWSFGIFHSFFHPPKWMFLARSLWIYVAHLLSTIRIVWGTIQCVMSFVICKDKLINVKVEYLCFGDLEQTANNSNSDAWLSILKIHFPNMAAVTGQSPVRELVICVRNRCVFLGFVLINPIQTETIFVGS